MKTPWNVPAFKMKLRSLFTLLIASSVAILVPVQASNDAREPPSTDSVPAATAWLKQNIQCQYDSNSCPEFLSQDKWDQETARCCPGGLGSGLTLHVQRRGEGGCVWACLTATTCQAGEFPLVEEEHRNKTRYARVTCEPCKPGDFDPKHSESYKHRSPICRQQHQRCRADHGKTLVRAGNATHDTLCRCSWEEGFSPVPNMSRCTGPAGFDGNTICHCERYDCQEDMQLNHEFKCVPKPPSTENSESTRRTADPSVDTREASDATPTVDGDEIKGAHSHLEGWGLWLYITCLCLCLLIPAAILVCKFHP